MSYREYLLSLYRRYLVEHNDKILKDNDQLKLSNVFLSFDKSKSNLYSVKLHNVNHFTTNVEDILSNVTYNEAINVASFLISYFNANNDVIAYYGPSVKNLVIPTPDSYADKLKLYLMVHSVSELDFTYDDLNMLIELYDLEGSSFVEEKINSYLTAIKNDLNRSNNVISDQQAVMINKANNLKDEFKKTYLKALISKNPCDVYDSLNSELQERFLDLYFDSEVLDLDYYIDDYYATLDVRFNFLLYNHIRNKMFCSEVGKVYQNPISYVKNHPDTLNSMQLVLYKNLLIDLNAKQYIYRFDSIDDDAFIKSFASNGIEIKKYQEFNLK